MTHARRDRRAVWAAILRAIEDGEPHQMSEVVYEVRTNYSLIAKHCEALQIVGFPNSIPQSILSNIRLGSE